MNIIIIILINFIINGNKNYNKILNVSKQKSKRFASTIIIFDIIVISSKKLINVKDFYIIKI